MSRGVSILTGRTIEVRPREYLVGSFAPSPFIGFSDFTHFVLSRTAEVPRLSVVILHELEATLQARRSSSPEESYTARLLADPTLNQRKIMEEAFEVCLELQASPIDPERTAEEAADVMYHLLVALVGAGVAVDDVFAVLEGRKK